MKKFLLITCMLATAISSSGQTFSLKVIGASDKETTTIDSTGYQRTHATLNSSGEQVAKLLADFKKTGYLAAELKETTKQNDSSYLAILALGPRAKNIHIYIGKNPEVKMLAFADEKRDTLTMPFSKTEAFMESALARLESKGYSLAELQLVDIVQRDDDFMATLSADLGSARQVSDIVISGYDKFPEGHRKQIKRLYRNRTFNRQTLQKIHSDFQNFRFVTQTRYPEILFTKDTTKIYVYLEKAKANRFDGFVGFSNDEQEGSSKVRFNGYLDLLLVNTLNIGEDFSLYWKSDGKDQKTFNASIGLPYIFKTPFALKASLNIFKQDSTFQNTKTAIGLGYFFKYNTRLYLGYEASESSDIQNVNSAAISDFSNAFATTTFEFTAFRPEDFLFPEKTSVVLRGGIGSRESKLEKNAQGFIEANIMHNLYLNEKNSISLRSQNYFLQSDSYLVSELYRFGGINSIRGFNENSLQANVLTSLMTEYRFAFASGIYAHSIIDYGYFRDESRLESTGNTGNLLGLGFGFGLLSKNGLFNIIYANGTADGAEIKLSNSIVHVSFRARF